MCVQDKDERDSLTGGVIYGLASVFNVVACFLWHPILALAIAGAIVLGLVAARFLREYHCIRMNNRAVATAQRLKGKP